MGLFTNKEYNSLDDLFVDQIRDLYDAEQRLVKSLPKMIEAASSGQLKTAFEEHLRETETHVNRLEQVFRQLGEQPKGETCEAMKGLIEESQEAISAKGDTDVRDAALIAAAQRIEHYEIAGYGTARTFAQRLGHMEVADLLQQTLEEEATTDERLTDIATTSINIQAGTQPGVGPHAPM